MISSVLLASCGQATNTTTTTATGTEVATGTTTTTTTASQNNLEFDMNSGVLQTAEVNGKTIEFYAFEKISYVKNPVDTKYQVMNVYIPKEYFENKTINGYTKDTAPIFFPNGVGGYMPAEPKSATATSSRAMRPASTSTGTTSTGTTATGSTTGTGTTAPTTTRQSVNSVTAALAQGYIVASAGARGRSTTGENGEFTGKAPAGIVDLKAAIRYLKYNDGRMAGDANKIISNGTSAGGAMSSLIGATGNSKDYEKYLQEIGAADATDDVFAASVYCAITDLNHADMAYEWQFNGVTTYSKMSTTMLDYNVQRTTTQETFTDAQMAISAELKKSFPAYVNSLNLVSPTGEKLTLDADGNGSFKNYIKSKVVESFNKAIKEGNDVSSYTWLKIENNVVVDIDFDEYVKNYFSRNKGIPAFDAFDLSAGENNLFGNTNTDNQHFTDYSVANNTATGATRVESEIVKMMNPLKYIDKPDVQTAKYWRIRHGAKDADTSLAIPTILATTLANNGAQVDFALPWNQGHGGDYDLTETFAWIDSIAK